MASSSKTKRDQQFPFNRGEILDDIDVRYLQNDELPPRKNEAWWTKAKATRFCIIDGKLYKRSFSGPYFRCINNIEVECVLAELNKGKCGNHSRAQSLAYRVLTARDYWPTMQANSINHVKKIERCLWFANASHLPTKMAPFFYLGHSWI